MDRTLKDAILMTNNIFSNIYVFILSIFEVLLLFFHYLLGLMLAKSHDYHHGDKNELSSHHYFIFHSV